MSADRAMRLRRAGALALTVALTACSWFTDFKQQPKPDPWESPNDSIPMRGNPQFSVSIYGSAAPGYAVSRASLPTTIDSMAPIPNPVPAGPDRASQAAELLRKHGAVEVRNER
jgi:hypothetical protein